MEEGELNRRRRTPKKIANYNNRQEKDDDKNKSGKGEGDTIDGKIIGFISSIGVDKIVDNTKDNR